TAVARAVYFEADPNIIRLNRIDGDAGDSRRADGLALRRDFHRPPLPTPASVLRTEDHRRRRRAGPDKHVFRIYRVDPYRPDIMGIERRVDVLPFGSRILAAIQPSFRTGEKNIVLLRMHRDTTHRSFVGKPTARPNARPGLAIIFTPHDALPDSTNDDCYLFHDYLHKK